MKEIPDLAASGHIGCAVSPRQREAMLAYERLKPKWCSHCRKENHNDSECWSTRALPPRPLEECFLRRPQSESIPFNANQIIGAMNNATEKARQDD